MAPKPAAERRLSAQHAVALALADSPALSDATPRILRAICQSLGWAHGALWEAAGDAPLLTWVDTRHHPNLALPNFDAPSQETRLPPGGGLPGPRGGRRRP